MSNWDMEVDIVVVGAGGCGLAAAAAAAQRGAQVFVLEKSLKPLSNTFRSGGMIPGSGSRFQKEQGVVDSNDLYHQDIMSKNQGTSDPLVTRALVEVSARLVEWLNDEIGVQLSLVTDFLYPGHSSCRMHAPADRTGATLINDLENYCRNNESIDVVNGAEVTDILMKEDSTVGGVLVKQGSEKTRVGARKVILACNGFAGNPSMVSEHCPQVSRAVYFGGEGSTGDGIKWGQQLGAAVSHMDAFQGHSTVSLSAGILITYAIVMEGGVLVNNKGQRFGDETQGYSEFSLEVLHQPDGEAFLLYDEELHGLGLSFSEYKEAQEIGAIQTFRTREGLFDYLDNTGLTQVFWEMEESVNSQKPDSFGRSLKRGLEAPFYLVKVTGALFHTQGGLKVDHLGRVLRRDGSIISHLYAGGGVAVGISGHGCQGYLSGNGLLSALGLGYLAGQHAAGELNL